MEPIIAAVVLVFAWCFIGALVERLIEALCGPWSPAIRDTIVAMWPAAIAMLVAGGILIVLVGGAMYSAGKLIGWRANRAANTPRPRAPSPPPPVPFDQGQTTVRRAPRVSRLP